MKASGSADLRLMGGGIPRWLFDRMVALSRPVVEAIIVEGGKAEFIRRLSDPFWFQSFACVIGMDWNSSGATTAVMAALRKSLNPHSDSLGLYICGGKGSQSRKTPQELLRVGERTGLDGARLARYSKLSAKVDNTAIQDGFQIYQHHFVVTDLGQWAVIQQGMDPANSAARRYHWHSEEVTSFVEEPHTAVLGIPQEPLLNLTDRAAATTRSAIVSVAHEKPAAILREARHLVMPHRTAISKDQVDLKRLGSILWLAQETEINQFEDLLLLKGLGPQALRSLTLVSELIHGTPSRFSDPARYAFAHGSKSGNPYPVPTVTYDETIQTLRTAVERAKLGQTDKYKAIRKLTGLAQRAENQYTPNDFLEGFMAQERTNSWKVGGRTATEKAKPSGGQQLRLF